jgi:hypothetical protein
MALPDRLLNSTAWPAGSISHAHADKHFPESPLHRIFPLTLHILPLICKLFRISFYNNLHGCAAYF